MFRYILYSVDGHHKLIRWKIVTHGCIDGYSRLVVYLKASMNNRASTVYEHFLKAVQQFGLPSRIRCDQGVENILVAEHMLHHRGVDRNSALVGSSVHNQRIEGLWRDMHRCCTQLFYRLFYFLEESNLLNPVCAQHIYALHYVFLGRINRALNDFAGMWNHHSLRTEKGLSPHQLFTSGVLQLTNSGLTAMDLFDVVPGDYGNIEEGVVGDDDEGIEIPQCEYQLLEDDLEQLQQTVNPLQESDNYGIDLYFATLQYLQGLQ